jgi:hypothetical protein
VQSLKVVQESWQTLQFNCTLALCFADDSQLQGLNLLAVNQSQLDAAEQIAIATGDHRIF